MSIVEEGFEGPIDNFVFRQCPSEFKLKIAKSKSEIQNWTRNGPSKTSLLQISHEKGIILFPHYQKGALAFTSIKNLAEKENLSFDFLTFPGDESLIISMCLDPFDQFIFVGKASKKFYAIDLASYSPNSHMKPFVSKMMQLNSEVVDCIVTVNYGLFILLENGKLMNFQSDPETLLQDSEFLDLSEITQEFSCISHSKDNGLLALGLKESSNILLIKLNEDRDEDEKISIEIISIPCEELGCGNGGISSIFMFADGNSALFSCKPDNLETDDVPLLLLENIVMGDELRFSFYFDPCASRPPRENQFYFTTLPICDWTDNLSDLVILGNYSSPDLGVCGKLSSEEEFQTFYIDNDEGLAQLPFVNGKAAYPLGMALDLSSTSPVENLNDPYAPKYPPAPIIWVLTDTAQLCPFYLLKTDVTEPHCFMHEVPDFKISDELVENKYKDLEVVDVSPSKSSLPQQVPSTPQTPSKVPLQQLASLQKSTEIKPIEPFNFKQQTTPVVKKIIEEEPEPVLVKKTEKMESINVGAYQNILLAEVAATHAAMQNDLFTLKEISIKNGHLIRQNSQKYFNSLESLENYDVSLEKLLASSEKVFAGVKDRMEDLKGDLKELLGKSKQVKSSWNRIKQDNKINWDARVHNLSVVTQELIERIDRVRNFMSNPIEASKYQATLDSFISSAQEKIQILMAHLSGLFVCENDDISTVDFNSLSLSPSLSFSGSSDNLLEQLNILSIGREESDELSVSKKYSSLLNAVKTRGARLLIPNKIVPTSPALNPNHLKLSSEDESLISSFIASIKLTENVPDFPETAVMAKLSLDDKYVKQPETEIVKPVVEKKLENVKPFELKTADVVKPFEFKALEISKPEIKSFETTGNSKIETKSAEPVKPFAFNVSAQPSAIKAADAITSKPFEFKTATDNVEKAFNFSISKPEEVKSTDTTPKIPSIFTSESILKKESPLPTFDSLNFGQVKAEKKIEESEGSVVKPFPSIFGVKPEKIVEAEVASFSSPPTQTASTAFSFNFKPESTAKSVEVVKEDAKEDAKEPAKEITPASASASTPASASPSLSFSFAPASTNTTTTSPTAAPSHFSITAKPTLPTTIASVTQTSLGSNTGIQNDLGLTTNVSSFGQTSNPTFGQTSPPAFGQTSKPAFGQTSLPSAFGTFGQSNSTTPSTATTTPAFGQTSKPAFGQTSLPTATGFSFASAPASTLNYSSASSSGFAAFASTASAGNSTSFSSFASPAAAPSGSGLTFATFLPDSQKTKDLKEKDKNPKPASSTFSFSGFRE